MHHSRLIFVATLCTWLVNCTPDRKADDGSPAALARANGSTTFTVKRVRPNVTLDGLSETLTWKIPTSFRMGVQACIDDRANNKETRNQDFTVMVPGSERVYNVRTTNQGCFTWQEEKIAFNYYAPKSGWLLLNRDIVGRGVNRGKQRIQIMVNPWKLGDKSRDGGLGAAIWPQDGDNGVLPTPDQVFATEDQNLALVGESATQRQATDSPRLLITDMKVMKKPGVEGSNFVTYTFQIDMKPKIKVLNSIGMPSYQDTPDGDFNIWLQVIQTGMGPQLSQDATLLDAQPFSVGYVVNGVLRAKVQVRQPREVNQGNMQIALKVAPRAISVMGSIQPFEGLFNFGQDTVIKDGSGSIDPVCLITPKDCSYEKAVEKGRVSLPDLEASGYVRPKQRYIFNNLRLRFLMVEPGETATQRTVAYTASTCIVDHDTGRPLRNTPMIIRYLKQPGVSSKDAEQDQHEEVEPDVIAKSTDQSGCLNWDGRAFHKYYQPERYFERMISIEKPSGFKQDFKFYINPWDTNVNFGFDEREFGENTIRDMRSRPKIRGRFFLGDFAYHTVKFLYNIDNYMDLEVRKWVLMELVPQVLRYSGIKDARKMTEHLRDGIYLMKVGLQKNFLDPRNSTPWTLANNKELQAEVKTFGRRSLPVDQYVTTNMALVRVVDGMIIYPLELTMRDLRLMRVRSNFMIELQTVDERLIQAYHTFKAEAINAQDLENKLRDFKRDNADSTAPLPSVASGQLNPGLLRQATDREALAANNGESFERAEADLKTRVENVHRDVAKSLAWLKNKFNNPDDPELSFYLNATGEDIGLRQRVLKDSFITDNFSLNDKLLSSLKATLKTNDFSEVALPKKEAVDLNLFVQDDSGLRKRSFVGPVIFLSNGYKDSLRATDNLDEAGCINPDKPQDAADRAEGDLAMRGIEVEKIQAVENQLSGKRQNNAYTYSEYFGSLTHLCYKNVDDLIEWQAKFEQRKADQMAAASLKSNFVSSFGLDYLSLDDAPLTRVRPGCTAKVSSCLEADANLKRMKVADVAPLLEANLGATRRRNNWENLVERVTRADVVQPWSSRTSWRPEEYHDLFFTRSADTRVALCTMMANRLVRRLRENHLSHYWFNFAESFDLRANIVRECVQPGGLKHDLQDRVLQTGSYMLLGGLNLNINVSTSFGTSWGGSWSGGLDLKDLIGVGGAALGLVGGGPVGAAIGAAGGTALGVLAGAVAKPFGGLKYGKTMGNSVSTGESEQTYLVGQMAKFDVDLMAYEKCAVVGLSDQAVAQLRDRLAPQPSISAVNFADESVIDAAKTGLLVCEGDEAAKANPKKTVEEMYFYFTQHFTEGDMLDQSELYNHPWLMALRGMRDYTAFISRVREQELAQLGEFKHSVTNGDKRPMAEPLEHMRRKFANTHPSFPGFYTELTPDQDIKAFLLQQSVSTKLPKRGDLDQDPFGEVSHPTVSRAKADAR